MAATCVVCGTEDSGVPGFGMALSVYAEHPRQTYHVCKAHADTVQVGLDGYDRVKGKDTTLLFRRMTRAEAQRLTRGQDIHFIHFGETHNRKPGQPLPTHPVIRKGKVTSVKLWKTRPNDVVVKWQYGMYAHGTSSDILDGGYIEDLVVLVS